MPFLFLILCTLVPHLATDAESTPDPIAICPELKPEILFCERQWEKCIREERREHECGRRKIDCVEEFHAETQECQSAVDEISVTIKKNVFVEHKTDEQVVKLLDSWLNRMKNAYTDVIKNCFSGDYETIVESINAKVTTPSQFFSTKYSHVIAITNIGSKLKLSEKCKAALEELQTEVKYQDETIVFKSPIPLNQWHCSWENGDLGKMTMRKTAEITVYHQVEQFNRCCARQRDCYVRQGGMTECNQDFNDCNQKLNYSSNVHDMPGNKLFVQYLAEIESATGEIAYKMAPLTEFYFVTHNHRNGFEYDGSCTKTAENNKCYAVLLELSDVFDEYDRNKLRRVYRMCPNASISISLCAYEAQRCHADRSESIGCAYQLDGCLTQCCPKANDAKHRLQEIKKWLSYYSSHWWFQLIVFTLFELVLTSARPVTRACKHLILLLWHVIPWALRKVWKVFGEPVIQAWKDRQEMEQYQPRTLPRREECIAMLPTQRVTKQDEAETVNL